MADNLRGKMVQLNPLCHVCSERRESSHRILLRCKLARECWLHTPFPMPGQFVSLSSRVSSVFQVYLSENARMVVVICWALRFHRNNLVWKNQCWAVSQVLHITGKTISEWTAAREARYQSTISLVPPCQYPTRWEKPAEGICELNVDAALFSQRGMVGFGCVLRGATGAFISARVSTARLNMQPHEAEAQGRSCGAGT